MRVNAAIVASLTGAAFAYPVLDSYKEVKEVPAYGSDPQAPEYTAHDVYGDKPAYPSSSDAPAPKQEKPKEKPVPSKPAETQEECISKRSALGLDFSACTKGAFQGSIGGSKAPAAPKASPVPMASSDVIAPDASEPKEPTEPLSNSNILDTDEINKILSSPADLLPLGEVTQGRKDGDVSDSSFVLPIGKNIKQLLPSDSKDPKNPSSDPLTFATNAAEQLQKSGFLPKRQVRPSFNADGTANSAISGHATADEDSASFDLTGSFSTSAQGSGSLSERQVRPSFNADGSAKSALSGHATADEDSASFDLVGSFSTSASGSGSLSEREALQLSTDDDEDDSSLTGFLLPVAKLDGDGDSAPFGLTGSLTGAVMGSASASSAPVKRTALHLGEDAESASFNGNAAGSAQGQLSGSATGLPTEESASFNGNAAGRAQGQLSGSATGLPTEESASFNGNAAANAAANAQSDIFGSTEGTASGSFDLKGSFNGQLAGSTSANKREAQLSLDEVTALLAPLTGSPAPKAGGAPAKRDLDLPTLPIDSADFFGDFKGDLEGQLTTSTSAAADSSDADDEEDEMVKRNAQLALDSITALLAPLTGSPAPAAGGAPAKREAQLSLDSITALLAPLTGAPAPAAGGAPAKRQLSLDSITALLAPITGSPAPKAGAAPAKREAQLSLDEVTALLAPVTGSPAPKAGGAAKRQLGLDAVTGLLAPITGAPAPGAPAKRDSQYSEIEKEEKSIPEPANIHFGPGALTGQADIQCIKSADGKCKTTGSVEGKLTPPEQDMFDPVAPQYHGNFDAVKKLIPNLKPSTDDKEIKPTHEKPEILGSLKNLVPVPV